MSESKIICEVFIPLCPCEYIDYFRQIGIVLHEIRSVDGGAKSK